MSDTDNTAAAGDANEQHAEGFKAPSSQEELDQIINKAVARTHKKYEGFDDFKAKAEKFDGIEAENADLKSKVEGFESEKQRVALLAEVAAETGVPASALRGGTREELVAHADELKPLLNPSAPAVPGQEKQPSKVEASEELKAARQLFGT